MKLKEAFENYGKKKSKVSIAVKLWPEATKRNAQQNMSRLINGEIKTVKLEWLKILSDELECTIPQLLGIEPFGNGG